MPALVIDANRGEEDGAAEVIIILRDELWVLSWLHKTKTMSIRVADTPTPNE